MTPVTALVLGIVEGLTEYLPVSSTGHLIVAAQLMKEKPGSFEVVIQLGAVMAVAVHYRALLGGHVKGLFAKKPESLRLLVALMAAFVPTAIAGLLFRKVIKAHLFNGLTVGIAFAVGGVLMIVVERVRAHRRKAEKLEELTGLEHVTWWRGLMIGLGQCVSLIPGSSRSMSTIVAGQLTGLSTSTAAEFSFLLALPTLGAACVYEGYKGRAELGEIGGVNLAIGLVVSFLVAWAVIATFLRYLKHRGLEPFGYYRIVAGVVVIVFMMDWFKAE